MKYITAQELQVAERNAQYIEDTKQLLLQEWLEYDSTKGFTVNLMAFLHQIDVDELDHIVADLKKRNKGNPDRVWPVTVKPLGEE